ncbi:MAG: two-component system sensor histidine kinase NtrB [Candidatus Anammoxibacter sp.]
MSYPNIESELKRSVEKYKSIVEFSRDAIILVDVNLKVLEWNRGAETLYGYQREEIIGKAIPIIPKSRLKELRKIHDKLRKGEPVQNFETVREHKNGSLKDVVLTLSPIKGENQETNAIISIARDITDQKKLQKQLQQTEKLSGIGRLAAGIAHQLNTPLASIRLSAQMIEETIENRETMHDVKKIIRQTGYCKKIINQLLAFSKPSGAKKRTMHLAPLINNVEKLLEKILIEKNVKIEKTLLKDNDKVFVNKNQIEQVFFNILSNAIDAMPEGGQITITTETIEENKISIKISDTGAGIEKKNLPIIFEPFFTTKKIGEGTGLGLSICYGLVEDNEGTIDVDSKVGKGTTFTVKFPLASNRLRHRQ